MLKFFVYILLSVVDKLKEFALVASHSREQNFWLAGKNFLSMEILLALCKGLQAPVVYMRESARVRNR